MALQGTATDGAGTKRREPSRQMRAVMRFQHVQGSEGFADYEHITSPKHEGMTY